MFKSGEKLLSTVALCLIALFAAGCALAQVTPTALPATEIPSVQPTSVPTATKIPSATATLVSPTETPEPATATEIPSATPIPATATETPSPTPIPVTATAKATPARINTVDHIIGTWQTIVNSVVVFYRFDDDGRFYSFWGEEDLANGKPNRVNTYQFDPGDEFNLLTLVTVEGEGITSCPVEDVGKYKLVGLLEYKRMTLVAIEDACGWRRYTTARTWSRVADLP